MEKPAARVTRGRPSLHTYAKSMHNYACINQKNKGDLCIPFFRSVFGERQRVRLAIHPEVN